MKRPAAVSLLVCWLGLTSSSAAQQVQRLVDGAPDGYVRLSFSARPDTCRDGVRQFSNEHTAVWEPSDTCEGNLVHVQLEKENGAVIALRTFVGGRWRPGTFNATDLGVVAAPAASAYLLGLVRTDPVSHHAIHPAALADSSVVWPQLLALASDPSVAPRTSKESMVWLGIIAGRLFDDDESRDVDREARRGALFAISQLPPDEGVPRLIDISATNRFEYVRRRALFWLGQSGDPRALPVFEQIFRQRGARDDW